MNLNSVPLEETKPVTGMNSFEIVIMINVEVGFNKHVVYVYPQFLMQ